MPNLARRQAGARRGRVQGEEPSAPAVPVGPGGARRDRVVSAGVYGGMLGQTLVEEPIPHLAHAGDRSSCRAGRTPCSLDVRTKTDYETSPLKLPGSVRLDPDEVVAGRIDLAAEPARPIVAYDTSPEESTSAQVCQAPRARGYRDARILKGGLGGWTNARLPIEAKSHLPVHRARAVQEHHPWRRGEAKVSRGDSSSSRKATTRAVRPTSSIPVRWRSAGIDDCPERVNQYGEGELFGEMALFRKSARSADALCRQRGGAPGPQERTPRVADPQPARGHPRGPEAAVEPRRRDRSGAVADGQMTPRSTTTCSASRESPSPRRRSPRCAPRAATAGWGGTGGVASLAWSPDGRKLLFLVEPFAPRCGYCSRLWVLNADGSGLRDLTRSLGRSGSGGWARLPILSGRPTDGSSPSCD